MHKVNATLGCQCGTLGGNSASTVRHVAQRASIRVTESRIALVQYIQL